MHEHASAMSIESNEDIPTPHYVQAWFVTRALLEAALGGEENEHGGSTRW